MTGEFRHEPVMLAEILDVFAAVPAGWLVDMTLGGGGHSRRLLEERPDCRLLGLDQDLAALAAATSRLSPYGERAVICHTRFDSLSDVMAAHSIDHVSGVLFDLGVSSHQFDEGERGFSYRFDGPLDMRMNPTLGRTAADVVNEYSLDDLTRVLREYGDERFAYRIANALVAHRPIRSTGELAEIVRAAIPAAARRTGGHPAKRTFQALRIEVNQELDVLPEALNQAIDAASIGGRVAVLSYHSGEDRIVKRTFRTAASGGCRCPQGYPCGCGAVATVRIVRPEKRVPSTSEIERNPRAASAILRVAEKITVPGDAQ